MEYRLHENKVRSTCRRLVSIRDTEELKVFTCECFYSVTFLGLERWLAQWLRVLARWQLTTVTQFQGSWHPYTYMQTRHQSMHIKKITFFVKRTTRVGGEITTI